MSKLTRDRTAEPVSRDQLLGANADREMFISPVQLTPSRIGNLTRLIHTLAICVMTINTSKEAGEVEISKGFRNTVLVFVVKTLTKMQC